MTINRREFIMAGIVGAGVLILPSRAQGELEGSFQELSDVALNTARKAGASYADIRISRERNQSISTRENRVKDIQNSESFGCGIRVLVNGTWGFAATHQLTKDKIAETTRGAIAIARANQAAQRRPVRLAPVQSYRDSWKSPIEKDPFDVPIKEKVDLLLALNEAALKVQGAKYCESSMLFFNQQKFFASTEGSYIEQSVTRSFPTFTVTAVDTAKGEFQTRSVEFPRSLGYEHVESTKLIERAPEVAEEAVRKLSAKSVQAGKRDLILHPSHLWLTIHESIGHPTELDRALGYEANFAGTSFLTVDKLGRMKVGSEIVNFKADKTIPGGLASCGYDDDGVKTTEWYLIKEGIFVDYQTIRDQVYWPEYQNARKAAGLPEVDRSYGCSYADRWSSIPFQRMPNVHLEAGKKDLSLDDLIADTKEGIYIIGDGSYSIDQQRYNFQFGGELFFEIKNGKITEMLRDVAYQATTQDFWNSCDAICDQRFWEMGGSFYDGKGEPGQSNAVSHGCSPARFRQINVLNTARKV